VLGVRCGIGDETGGGVELEREEVAVHVWLERGRADEVSKAKAVISARKLWHTYVSSSSLSTNLKSA
jgi:hypothetical protein